MSVIQIPMLTEAEVFSKVAWSGVEQALSTSRLYCKIYLSIFLPVSSRDGTCSHYEKFYLRQRWRSVLLFATTDGMSIDDFRKYGKEMVDYICKYNRTIASRRVISDVEPFYLRALLPAEAPHEPEDWDTIMKDVEEKIMPGVTHWCHPNFFAYFANANTYPAIFGEMLSDCLATLGHNWFVNPANTELEMVVTDWYGKALGLPKAFLHSNGSKKCGGCTQGSASESIFAVLMTARYRAIKQCLHNKEIYGFSDQWDVLKRLVSYTSKGAHTCVEKAAKMASLRMRLLDVDEKCCMRGDTLQQAIEADLRLGLIPCFVAATLGTTGEAAFDNLKEIGMVCRDYPLIWLHVDAAYGGSLFVCKEFRYLLNGIEDACSINVNPNKWFLVNFECSCVWLKDYQIFNEALAVNRLYLEQDWMDIETVNLHNWGTPLSRRFRVLKLWFVMRTYGIQGLQNYIRNHCNLALLFESLVRKDNRFVVMNDVKASLVCFRVVKMDVEVDLTEDEMTELLLAFMNSTGEVHMVAAHIRGYFSIRFCVVYQYATEELIRNAWDFIQQSATHIECFIKNQDDYPSSKKLDPKDRTQMSNMVKKYAYTKSVPVSKYREGVERSSLHDCHMPVLVPQSSENIVNMVNISELMSELMKMSYPSSSSVSKL